MRIIQIIDSLHVGGAERIAVNYANALSGKIAFSGLVTTRKEGELKSQVDSKVGYLFLKKSSAVDPGAILRLRSYCKQQQVGFVHVHGTSFFTAFLLKLVYPKIKIVWHEHKGARSSETLGPNRFLLLCSKFFNGIIVVDHTLEAWCRSILGFKEVLYLPNFTLSESDEAGTTTLKGAAGKRILCLANLRAPKNHSLLVDVAVMIKKKFPDWSFHLVGNDFDDDYSKALKRKIAENFLEETVYIYGLKEDSAHIIAQTAVGVLSSKTEGLPVALLEYGLHKKAVVATEVGEIPLIIRNGENGFIVPSENAEMFGESLSAVIENEEMRKRLGEALYRTIMQNHSEETVIGQYLDWLNRI